MSNVRQGDQDNNLEGEPKKVEIDLIEENNEAPVPKQHYVETFKPQQGMVIWLGNAHYKIISVFPKKGRLVFQRLKEGKQKRG